MHFWRKYNSKKVFRNLVWPFRMTLDMFVTPTTKKWSQWLTGLLLKYIGSGSWYWDFILRTWKMVPGLSFLAKPKLQIFYVCVQPVCTKWGWTQMTGSTFPKVNFSYRFPLFKGSGPFCLLVWTSLRVRQPGGRCQ